MHTVRYVLLFVFVVPSTLLALIFLHDHLLYNKIEAEEERALAERQFARLQHDRELTPEGHQEERSLISDEELHKLISER